MSQCTGVKSDAVRHETLKIEKKKKTEKCDSGFCCFQSQS